MAPRCSVFKDQAPEKAQRETLSTAGAVSNRPPTCRRERARALRLAEPEGPLHSLPGRILPGLARPAQPGTVMRSPRTTRARFRRPRDSTSRRPPRKSSVAGACARIGDLRRRSPRGRRRRPAGRPRRCSRRGRRAGTARRRWAPRRRRRASRSAHRRAPTSSSAGSASASRPRPNSASEVRVDARAARRSPCTSTVSSARQRTLRGPLVRALARWRGRAPRSPRASGTRTRAGTGPRRRRPGCSQNW